MEPEDSLPPSQVSATCPYPEPARSSPWPHIPLPDDPFNIILPSTPESPKWPLSLRFLHQNTPNVLHAPAHSFWFDHAKNIGWGLQIIKLLIMWFSTLTCYIVPLRPKYSPQYPILKHHKLTFLPQYEPPCFIPIQNNGKNYACLFLNI